MARALASFGTLILVLILVQAVKAQDKAEGKKYYVTYCSGCHGETGKGDGPAAVSLPVKPANHTDGAVMNQLPDKFLFEIISKGGQSVGKSPFMPAWGSQLRDKQIQDVIAYVRSLANPPYKSAEK
ncbi:MAG TPA: cytochrome c [Candidatus Binatia bacterium]|jgi:mono/diheme cytochrome c family protein